MMDIYDPQTLGVMVFGGFMVISAIAIVLVSTFSMKETSYEEALAKQRKELGKMQPQRPDKKKKDKASEKKNRGKKKEEKPNGKLPEVDQVSEAELVADPVPEPVAIIPASEPTPAPAPSPAPEPPAAHLKNPAAAAAPAEAPPAPSPKEKKKKEKKAAKVEPTSTQPAPTPSKPAAPAPPKSSVAPAPQKSTPAPAPQKSTPAPAPQKSTPAPQKSSPATQKSAPVLEAVPKDVPVMAVPPVGSQQAGPGPAASAKGQLKGEASTKKKASSKKKAEPEKEPAVDVGVEPPVQLPYKALLSAVSSMAFSEGEAQRLADILSDRAGAVQDTWRTATAKGDPVAVLKKQLEERDKQLAAEQEEMAATKNRFREMNKELLAEKAKVATVETRLSSQLSKREQEMNALQARMQASYQDHVGQTQRLNAKIVSLQEQLENGPTAQLARLQQENSILREALEKSNSQAESMLNTELTQLRQDCARLSKELEEQRDGQQADELLRTSLEAKLTASELTLSQHQASGAQREQELQGRLEEVCDELRSAQSRCSSLQDRLEQDNAAVTELQVRVDSREAELQQSSAQVEALTARLEEAQAERSRLEEQVDSINALLEASQGGEQESQAKAAELEQLKLSMQEREEELAAAQEELKQIKEAQQEVTSQQAASSEHAGTVASLEDELKHLREEMETLRNTPQSELTQLQNSLAERDAVVTSLQEELREAREQSQTSYDGAMMQLRTFQMETKETLQTLFPQVAVEPEQSNWLQTFADEAQEALMSLQTGQEPQHSTELPELLEKLKESEESRGVLQAECDQYRSVLAETEGMLKDLQKSVEEEEMVWKEKMAESGEQLKEALEKVHSLENTAEMLRAENSNMEQLKEQLMLLEAQLEKQSDTSVPDSQPDSEEMTQLQQKLCESQSQLELAQKEAQAQTEELAMIRQQLSVAMERAQNEEARGPHNGSAETSQVQSKLIQTTEKLQDEEARRQQVSEEFEQAQKTVADLQVQLDLLKAAGDVPQGDVEDVAQLKERLEKEKKLSKDLGQAATKLQQLLKNSQDQLAKERETVHTLQGCLDGKGESLEMKQGTSV